MDVVNTAMARASVNVGKKVQDPQVRHFGIASVGGYLVGWFLILGYWRLATASIVAMGLLGMPSLEKVRRDLEAAKVQGLGTVTFSKDFMAVTGAMCGLLSCTLSPMKLIGILTMVAAYFAAGF